jgi:hypothetical protein
MADAMAAELRAVAAKARAPDTAPDVREGAEMRLATALTLDDARARDYDAAAVMLPLLGGTPDAWAMAMRIAQDRPWEIPGRPWPMARRAAEASGDLDLEMPF